MDQGALRWTIKTARKNFWRVSSWYDLDDLIQDGHLHYWRIVKKYRRAKEPAHIMRLYQITFINHIHDLAKNRTRSLEVLAEDLGIPDVWSVLQGVQQELPPTMTIGLASPALQAVFSALSSDKGVRALRKPYVRRRTGRETFNERLCRIAGLDPRQNDVSSEIRGYFSAV